MATDNVVERAELRLRLVLHPAIFNHSERVRLIALHLARGLGVDEPALEVAALFHDSGTAAENDGDQRFDHLNRGARIACRYWLLSRQGSRG